MQGHEALLYPSITMLKLTPLLHCWQSYSDGFPWAYGCAPEQVSASLLGLYLLTNNDWSYLGQFLPGISELGRTVVVGSSSTWKDNYWQSGFLIYADMCFNKGSSVLLLLYRIWTWKKKNLWLVASGQQSDSRNTVDSVMENEAGGHRAGGDWSEKPQKKTGMKKLPQVLNSGCI